MGRNTEVAVVRRADTLPMMHPAAWENAISPTADIYETGDAFVASLDMPGAKKESINVSLDNDSLIVKAVVEPYHKENATLIFNELRNRTYYRAFNLGDGIERKNVDARYENGILEVKLYKSEERKPREIPIK